MLTPLIMKKAILSIIILLFILPITSFVSAQSKLDISSVALVEPADGIIDGKDAISIKAIITNSGNEDLISPFSVNIYVNDKLYSSCSGECELNYGIPVKKGLKIGEKGEIWWGGNAYTRDFLQEGINKVTFISSTDDGSQEIKKSIEFKILPGNLNEVDIGVKDVIIDQTNGNINSVTLLLTNNGPNNIEDDTISFGFTLTNTEGQSYGSYGSFLDLRKENCNEDINCYIFKSGSQKKAIINTNLEKLNNNLKDGKYIIKAWIEDVNGLINYKEINSENNQISKTVEIKKSSSNQTQSEGIKEVLTCIFKNSEKEQKCYLGKGEGLHEGISCSGISSCTIDVKGYKGTNVVWKSSCGGYQYTTVDGINENAEFDCSEGQISLNEIKNKGFSQAYWQCYDGEEQKVGGEEFCKPSEMLQKDAELFCQNHCENNGLKCGDDEKCLGKCGVNSFAVSGECYLDLEEFPIVEDCSLLNCANAYYNKELGRCECGTSESPELICKDSCPLDGKCYPFGYRKSGQFCSDSGKFIEQLKGDEICDNNFECSSNVCVDGQCISSGFLQKIIEWFKKLFGG